MSHLIVRKTDKGKFGIFNKHKGSFISKPSSDKEDVKDKAEKQDKKEDAVLAKKD